MHHQSICHQMNNHVPYEKLWQVKNIPKKDSRDLTLYF